MAILATDDFNRADGALGANWTQVTSESALTIISNRASGSNATNNRGAWFNAVAFPATQYAQCKAYCVGGGVASFYIGLGPSCRVANGVRTLYRMTANKNVAPTVNVNLSKHVAGVFTGLQQFVQAWTDGDTIRLTCQGTTLRMYLNGVQIGTDQTDASIATGAAGLDFSSSTTSFAMDDFEAGSLDVYPQRRVGVSQAVNRASTY